MLWMILVGLVIGALAKFVVPGRDPGGIIVTTLLGIFGSVAAEFVGRAIGWYRQGEPASFIASVLGAILILMLYRSLTGDRRSGPFARVS